MVGLHAVFEWDARKSAANLAKHGVSFEDAITVLADERRAESHIDTFDDRHSLVEVRWITTASHPGDRKLVLRVVWTLRWSGTTPVTRVISARKASRKERAAYEQAIKARSDGPRDP